MPTLAQRIADLAARTAAEIKALPKGTVTGVTGTAPIASSGGAAPVISIAAATTGTAGAMSAADKITLDGVASGATANTGTVTGVTGTSPIASSGGAAPVISIAPATTGAPGSMSAADKAKLDGVASGATANAYASSAEVKTGTEAAKAVSPQALKDSNIVLPAGGATGQILAKASATDFDRVWIDAPTGGGGGSAPALHPGYVTTHVGMANWYTGWDATLSNANNWAAGGQTLYHPLILPVATTIAKLAIHCNTGAANATVRLGIYSNVGGKPASRLVEAPVVSAATSGTKESVLSTPLTLAAGTYWLATCASGFAANFKGYDYSTGGHPLRRLPRRHEGRARSSDAHRSPGPAAEACEAGGGPEGGGA